MNELVVKIENVNGENVVSSREVAEKLGKEHKNVLKDIREKSLLRFEQWIIPRKYKANNGQEYDEYLLTKDGFIMLVFNYEGHLEFKEAYIKTFNELEEAVKNPLSMLLNMSKEELATNVLQLAQIVKDKDKLIEEQKPAVEFTNKLLKSKDNILIREYAKILQDEGLETGEKRLFKWFRENGYLNSKNEPYQRYMKYFAVIEKSIDTLWGEKTTFTTKITPSGQLYFLEKIKNS